MVQTVDCLSISDIFLNMDRFSIDVKILELSMEGY